MKGLFIPEITAGMFRNGCLESIEALMAEGEIYDIDYSLWIPVSERLPKGSDIVLLSLPPHIDPDGEECSASVICGHYIGGKDKEWGLSDGDTYGYGIVSIRKGTNPIAWMPLPEPYKAESEVEDVEYQRQIEQLEHDIFYEPTFNPEDGSM